MKNPYSRQQFTIAATHKQATRNACRAVSWALLSGLLLGGTAHAKLSYPYDGGPGGTLTHVSGTASVTSQFGNQSQSIAGQTSATANVNASGTTSVPTQSFDQNIDIPWTMQFKSEASAAGAVSLALNSTGSYNTVNSVMPPGSFVEQASWRGTLVNTTGATALFGVILYSNFNDALGYAAGFLGSSPTSGFSATATASFGNQQYDVSNYGRSFAINGVLLKPGESATVGLDFRISSTSPYALRDLAFGGEYLGSVSTPIAPVPEPATNALMALGLVATVFVAKRRKS